MTVITISREFGNVGDDIGERIAQRLGYHFVDKEFVGAVLSEYGLIDFDSEFETLPGFWERFDAQRGKHRDLMVSVLNQVVQAVARHGDVVIRGRSGFAILAGFADVLHVRLQAPLSVRVEQVMAQQQTRFGNDLGDRRGERIGTESGNWQTNHQHDRGGFCSGAGCFR